MYTLFIQRKDEQSKRRSGFAVRTTRKPRRRLRRSTGYVSQTHSGCHGHYRKAGRGAAYGYGETGGVSPSCDGTGFEPKVI